jgi:hypothetical protein
MIIVFFLAGAVLLLRARSRSILLCAACTAGLFVVSAFTVAVYAGTFLPTHGFGPAFNFAVPAVLTQDWALASVWLATAVGLGLLALWVAVALGVRSRRAGSLAFGVCVAAVSLVALTQMTSHVSRAGTVRSQTTGASKFVSASGLKPGDQLAVANGVDWWLWVPQAFEVHWTQPQFFNPARQSPPADATVVETPWPEGQSAQASWPRAPAGWRVVASSQDGGWVAWHAPGP